MQELIDQIAFEKAADIEVFLEEVFEQHAPVAKPPMKFRCDTGKAKDGSVAKWVPKAQSLWESKGKVFKFPLDACDVLETI